MRRKRMAPAGNGSQSEDNAGAVSTLILAEVVRPVCCARCASAKAQGRCRCQCRGKLHGVGLDVFDILTRPAMVRGAL